MVNNFVLCRGTILTSLVNVRSNGDVFEIKKAESTWSSVSTKQPKMENSEYTKIFIDTGIDVNEYERSTRKPLMRQCLITSGVCCVYFLQGLFLGSPTVLIAQIQADSNSTEIITDEMLSWLTTFPVISAIPSIVILPLLFDRIGRKRTFIFVSLSAIIGFIIFYNSSSLYYVLISAVFVGPAMASTITISPVLITEYTSPRYRGIFLPLKGATGIWGIWVSNATGTFFPWRNIAIVAFVCSVWLITVMAWPESPYWLAKRGRYAESAKSHRWLKGVNENSEKELMQIIISHKNLNNVPSSSDSSKFSSKHSRLSKMWSVITSSQFYKPVAIGILLIAQYHFTGKFVISMYAIEVLKHLTPDQSFVYKEMLILDGVTVFSMYIGCIISRYCKRRTLLLLFSGTGISLLYILSLYLYLASLSLIVTNDIVMLSLLTIFSLAISCGPMILCTSIYGEIIPPRYQDVAILFVGSGGVVIISFLLKLSPFIFKSFNMHGTFLFFAISSTIILIVLYIYLPETKDKTIQDIENFFSKTQVPVEENNAIAGKEVESSNLIV